MLILGPFVTARGCTSWCHWSDENCEKDPCVDCPRCQQLSRESKGPPVPPLVQKAAVAPDDPLIEYSGYLQLEVTRERATFERAYISNRIYSRNPGFKENPGARIRWRTDAQRVVVDLDYLEQCDESCPMDANRGCYARRVCYCHCRVRLFRDGDQEELFSRIQSGGKYGPGHFELPVVPYQASPTMHEYMMVLPWCASVAFRGIALESEASAPVPQLMALTPPPPRPRYVAWGDSITHGWCGNESYPARIARLNQWEPFNMGIQGMTMAAEVGHGIAGLKGDLYTLMVGANDCTGNGLGGFGSRMHEMLRTLRAALPHAVLVVLTPVEFGGCRIEPFREALRSGVSGLAAADSGVLLMEGKHLIPRGDFIEDGNPHPTSNGMVEMALNFNAELGFSQTRFQLRGCDPMRLQVMLPPNRDFVVYSGPSVELAHGEATRLRNTASCQPCCWRSFMVSPQSSLRGKTDATGVATVVLKGACDATAWQVMDLATCHTRSLATSNSDLAHAGTR